MLADSGPQDGSDHEWVRVVATFPAGNSMVRQMFWIRVSADPARRASQLRSLPVLQGFADTQIMVVRRRHRFAVHRSVVACFALEHSYFPS